jgi:hypothetical protein
MNVLIVDMDKIDVELANHVGKHVIEVSGTDDWIMLPKGIDILQDVPVEWLKHLRDQLDKKIKALEG